MFDGRQGHNSYDDDEDTENIRPKKVFQADTEGGYAFVTKLLDFEGGEFGVCEIRGQVLRKSEVVGSVSGWLINRHWRSNFYSSCDSISSELQLLSNVLFHMSGRLNKIQWRKEMNFNTLQRSLVLGDSSALTLWR